MKKLLHILAALLAATSCIYDFDAGDTGISDRVVIEGDISLGDVCIFSARPVRALGNKKYKDVLLPEAHFIVEDELGNSYTAVQINDQEAEMDLTAAPADRKYRLVTEIVSGESSVKYATPWTDPVPAPTIGQLTETMAGDYLNLGADLSQENGSGCYRWDYEELYRFHATLPTPQYEYKIVQGQPTLIDHFKINDYNWWPYTYCWRQTRSTRTSVAIAKSLDGWKLENHKVMTIPLRSDELGTGPYFFKLKAKSITEEAYKYLDAMNKGSDNVGSLLSPLPSDILGNIRNMADSTVFAIGYVSVNTVAKKIFAIATKGVNYWESERIYYRDPSSMYVASPDPMGEAYRNGYYPYKDYEGKLWWVNKKCIDCRLDGGSLEKPGGWEVEEGL